MLFSLCIYICLCVYLITLIKCSTQTVIRRKQMKTHFISSGHSICIFFIFPQNQFIHANGDPWLQWMNFYAHFLWFSSFKILQKNLYTDNLLKAYSKIILIFWCVHGKQRQKKNNLTTIWANSVIIILFVNLCFKKIDYIVVSCFFFQYSISLICIQLHNSLILYSIYLFHLQVRI